MCNAKQLCRVTKLAIKRPFWLLWFSIEPRGISNDTLNRCLRSIMFYTRFTNQSMRYIFFQTFASILLLAFVLWRKKRKRELTLLFVFWRSMQFATRLLLNKHKHEKTKQKYGKKLRLNCVNCVGGYKHFQQCFQQKKRKN